jgi:Mrp family chromosome partitioning ATPase/NifU-like protein involved in Fe-S cluster formation/predicted Fe-Mo cluster-binding NifX family protein
MQDDRLTEPQERLPANCGPLDRFDAHARVTGPCGDTMEIWLQIEGKRIARASFRTDGCGATVACGSLVASMAEGRSLEEAARIGQEKVLQAMGGLPEESRHCALLAADTLQAALLDFSARAAGRGNPAGGGRAEPDGSECGTCSSGDCSAKAVRPGESAQELEERRALQRRMCRIGHKVLVLSGKGGVGKSTVAVNLAVALSLAGRRVGLLDVDIHGPSIPKMLHLEGAPVQGTGEAILPVRLGSLEVMSIGFLLSNRDEAVIWRGPMKMGVIKQFLKDVEWGELDYLVIDSPPGTGDEPLSVCQLIEDADGAVIVTTPQEVATADVRRSVGFCRALSLPVLGVVENMSGFACPKCGEVTEIFQAGGGERMAAEMGVPFLGRVPIDPQIVRSGDQGTPYVHRYAQSPAARAFERVIEPILALSSSDGGKGAPSRAEMPAVPAATNEKKEESMRIAIPVAGGRLAMHFGHCEKFCLIDVDAGAGTILQKQELGAPDHQPGLLPRWLAERGAELIIAGGMGQRAQGLFAENGIRVVVGAPAEEPEALARSYLAGTLQAGENVCDH